MEGFHHASKKPDTIKLSTTLYFYYSYAFANFSRAVRYSICLTNLEKFDDIKFGKVLTKLYARLFSMEEHKFLPPKFSYSLKDLTSFLGIFEISEEDLKRQRADYSETSSNLSHITQGQFKPGKPNLEVVHENTSDNSASEGMMEAEENE